MGPKGGTTPLIIATTSTVDAVLDAGADPGARYEDGTRKLQTRAQAAVPIPSERDGRRTMAWILLDRGDPPDADDEARREH